MKIHFFLLWCVFLSTVTVKAKFKPLGGSYDHQLWPPQLCVHTHQWFEAEHTFYSVNCYLVISYYLLKHYAKSEKPEWHVRRGFLLTKMCENCFFVLWTKAIFCIFSLNCKPAAVIMHAEREQRCFYSLWITAFVLQWQYRQIRMKHCHDDGYHVYWLKIDVLCLKCAST